MKAISIIGAGGIARGGNRNALIGDRRAPGRAGELADHPAIGQLIVKHDGIAEAASLACAAEAAPKRDDTVRSEDGVAGGFVEDLVTFVDHLHVLREADGAIGIGRGAAATDAGEGDAVEIKDRRGNAGREEVKNRPLLDHRVRAIDVRVWYLRVFGGLALLALTGLIRGGHLAQRTRDVVMVGGDDLDTIRIRRQG